MDALLGLALLALYVLGMVALAALVTIVAIKIFPTKDRPNRKSKPPPSSDDGSGSSEPGQGRLFRRSKREATG